jgi:hypothetical protein
MALVRTDVSEESIASIIKMEGISDVGITLAVTKSVVLRSVFHLLVNANLVTILLILSTLLT